MHGVNGQVKEVHGVLLRRVLLEIYFAERRYVKVWYCKSARTSTSNRETG